MLFPDIKILPYYFAFMILPFSAHPADIILFIRVYPRSSAVQIPLVMTFIASHNANIKK
jgi:hypothetical protein